jgi:hypothetical protein
VPSPAYGFLWIHAASKQNTTGFWPGHPHYSLEIYTIFAFVGLHQLQEMAPFSRCGASSCHEALINLHFESQRRSAPGFRRTFLAHMDRAESTQEQIETWHSASEILRSLDRAKSMSSGEFPAVGAYTCRDAPALGAHEPYWWRDILKCRGITREDKRQVIASLKEVWVLMAGLERQA